MKIIVLGLAALLAGTAGLASAQDGPPPGGPMANRAMMRADANGDGIITRQEAIDEAVKRFDRMDLNHDGKIDQTEMAKIGERMRGMRGRGMGGDMPPPPPAPSNGMAPQ